MSRINVRYYKAHPPEKKRELSPAAYLEWHSMSPEQHEAVIKWSKNMNTAMMNLAKDVNDAMNHAFIKIHPSIQMEIERITSNVAKIKM